MLMDQGRKLMDQVVNWKNEIGTIAGPFLPTDTKTSWLSRAASKCAVSARQITSLYYGHITDPKYSVASSVLSAADKARVEQARKDALRLAEIYQNYAGALSEIDQNIHRDKIDVLVGAARILSTIDSARAEGEVK